MRADTPYFHDGRAGLTLYCGDALEVLRQLPAESAQCCITSPPYWSLRDYGTATWNGGDSDCDHRAPSERRQLPHGDGREKDCYADERVLIPGAGALYKEACGKCGAVRIDQQLGLEKTPEEYVARMVEIFREVRRVLRGDGTLWINLGDSYSNNTKWGGTSGGKNATSASGGYQGQRVRRGAASGLKPKDLVGIPWMTAFALRADGWYLRSDIIWHKPNPMPESVTDRPTKSHEYLFLMSKSGNYFYDNEAVAEPMAKSSVKRLTQPTLDQQVGSDRVPGKTNGNMKAVGSVETETRNRRSVWTIATQAFPETHFATFPEALVEPCILAGCPVGGVVLDPFSGAGTTGLVASRKQRDFIGIELSPEYAAMSARRWKTEMPTLPLEPADSRG